jgi:aspartyl-tRNA(Asn)/glutamyl-tRNA(Gln) amidotransferase subunit B
VTATENLTASNLTASNLTHAPVEGEHLIITSATTGDEWEIVVGLEVHCELATATKLFCACPNQFGSEPNTNVCPVCLGLPGSLPVLNRQVVELAMRLGRALHCTVEPSVFARKNYFYPDMPKDYQVSQYDRPINVDGWLDLPDGTRVGIERAHIEEDTGKNTHAGGSGRIHGADYSLVDYNRAGVPLVEIVGRPHIRHPEQAKTYIDELRAILLATGASDAKMEEGSLRVDANVSVRRVGDPELGLRCEIKNLNSLRSLGRAIEYEARRQVDLIEAGERVRQETRHWDEGAGRTRSGRSKEQAEDYRYFQEPDLVPLVPGQEWVAAVDAALPALPAERRARLGEAAGVTSVEAAIAVARDLDGLALAAIEAGADPARVLTHIEHNLAVEGAGSLDAVHFADLVKLEVAGQLTATQAKTVLAEMVASGEEPAAIAAAKGFEAMDTSELEGIVDGIIAESPDEWAGFCGDDDKKRGKLQGFFVGKVMKATRGQADGKAVTALLEQRRTAAS